MKRHPKCFDELYINLVAAGEVGGILDTILKRLAVYIEKAVKLKQQVKGAMIYPIAIIVIAAVVVGVILWKVIPTFASLFADFGGRAAAAHADRHLAQQQPRALHALHHRGAGRRQLRHQRYYDTERGRRVIDSGMLKVPVLGGILRKIAVARFTPHAGHPARLGRAHPRRASTSWPRRPATRSSRTPSR